MTQSFSFLTRQKCFWHSYVADWTPAPDDDLYYKSLTYFLLSSMIFDTKCLGLRNFCCRVFLQMTQMSDSRPASCDARAANQEQSGRDLFWRDWQAHQLACCCARPDTTEAENSKLRECAVRYFLVNKKLGFVFCALHSLEKLCQINCQNQARENTVKHIRG